MTSVRRGPIHPGETLRSVLSRPAELDAAALGQVLFLALHVNRDSPVVDLLLHELRQIAAQDARGAHRRKFGLLGGCACELCQSRRDALPPHSEDPT